MRRQAFFALLILLAGIVIAVIMVRSRPAIEPEPVIERAPLVQTRSLTLSTEPFDIIATGTVAARERVSVAAQVGGQIKYVNPQFVEGGQVSEGDILIRLDRADFENRVQSAKADLAAQTVNVLQAEEEVAIARSELAQFDARFSTPDDASSGAETTNGFQPPEAILQTAPNTLETSSISEEQRILASREPQLRSAEASRDRAVATLSDAELALSRTVVRAPFSGIIQSESVALGTVIAAGQTLGDLVASDAFEIRVSLSDQEAALIPGLFASAETPVPASVRATYAGETVSWAANIVRVSSLRDSQTRRVDIFLRVQEPLTSGQIINGAEDAEGPPLLIGTLVEVVMSGQPKTSYALVNTDYLRSENRIWLVENETLRIVDTTLIARTDDFAVISFSSLASRQTLITSDLRAPVDGMSVRISETE